MRKVNSTLAIKTELGYKTELGVELKNTKNLVLGLVVGTKNKRK